MLNKKSYFQGTEDPTPHKKKYKSDPALVVQPRFEEPFYRNYDLYEIPGMEHIGPGVGWHSMESFKSVKDFLEERRKRLQPKYVADDSWQLDNGERTKKNPIQARAAIFNRIIKLAKRDCKDSDVEYTDRRDAYICGNCLHMSENCGGPKLSSKELHAIKNHNPDRIDWRNDASRPDENDGSNFDYGDGAYTAMSEGKKMKNITDTPHKSPGAFFADAQYMLPPKEHGTSIYNWRNSIYQGKPGKHKKDSNDIDFPVDDDVNHDNPIRPEEGQYQPPRLVGPSGTDDLSRQPSDTGYDSPQIEFTTPQIAGEHSYLPLPDFDGRSDDALNFGRDYDDESAPVGRTWDEGQAWDDLDAMLEPAEDEIYGLPDGVDGAAKDADQTIQVENPEFGILDSGRQMYEDKWNI